MLSQENLTVKCHHCYTNIPIEQVDISKQRVLCPHCKQAVQVKKIFCKGKIVSNNVTQSINRIYASQGVQPQ
jgi:Zn finger protein HypA/HybF involved in hydrogenase expression